MAIHSATFEHCALYICIAQEEISHWADISIHVETFRTFMARHKTQNIFAHNNFLHNNNCIRMHECNKIIAYI